MRLRSDPVDPTDAGPDGRAAMALGVRPDRLHAWADAGLIGLPAEPGPDGLEFDLRDATLVRSLCNPDHPGLKPARLRRTLDRLRAWLPADAGPPGAVTLVDGGPSLLVRLGNGTLADPSGQFRFDFRHGDWPPLARLGRTLPTTAVGWHERGVDQELAGDPAAAADSYARSLLLGGLDTQVVFDLAHALADAGQPERAIERYRQVVELDPLRQDAWVNLGDLLLSAGRIDAAIDAFRRALDLDPDDPDAHYGMADAFDTAGEPARARPHWQEFTRLGGPPEHVAYARARLGAGPA